MIVEKKTFLSFCEINATRFDSKNKIVHTIIYHYMTSYRYISITVVDSCMIWFHFDCIMQLKKSYHIAINVCGRKSATTFGDLPDYSDVCFVLYRRQSDLSSVTFYIYHPTNNQLICLPGELIIIAQLIMVHTNVY